MDNSPKLKRCKVNLTRHSIHVDNVHQVQEQMSVRRCYVRVKRLNSGGGADSGRNPKQDAIANMRRCCIRVQRLNMTDLDSDTASVSSIISGRLDEDSASNQ